jgi:hypothetical protein
MIIQQWIELLDEFKSVATIWVEVNESTAFRRERERVVLGIVVVVSRLGKTKTLQGRNHCTDDIKCGLRTVIVTKCTPPT